MPEPKTLQLTVDVPAPPRTVFAAATDWGAQHEWMLGTRVRADRHQGRGVGGGIAAFTGVGPLGFWDTMIITRWDEPKVVQVDHTGKVVRGIGVFRVERAGNGSRLVWREEVDLPLGWLGGPGWYVVKPVLAAAVALSLRRFARFAVRA
ncbi:MAG: SRPBCC family protein [Candidatus Nanopelagicales bacterium]